MRWIIRIIGAALVAALLFAGALFAVPAERVAALVTERIAAATGREVVITGQVRPTLWPSLGVRAEGLRVGNPDWVEAGPMLAAESVHVSLEWAPLLRGEIRLDRAEIDAPDITLMRAPDGRVSWDFSGDAGAGDDAPSGGGALRGGSARGAGAMAIGFDRAEIVGGRLHWIDGVAESSVVLTGVDAVLSLPSPTATATIAGSAEVEGVAVSLDLSLEGIAPFLAGEVRPTAVSLAWPGGRAAFDGRLAMTPAFDGVFDIEATDPSPILSLAGAAMPGLPQGLGRDRIEAVGQLTLTTDGSVHLRDGRLALDDNVVALALDVTPGEERPFVRGTVTADALAFGPAAAGAGGGAGGGAAAPDGGDGWSTDPIDVSGLFSADAEVALRLGSLGMGAAEVGPVELNATLSRGRLVLDIGRIGVHGGRLAGQFVVNGRSGLSVGGDLILTEVQLNPLLTRFAGFDRLEGNGSASLQFLGVGNDLAAIMSGLRGEGDMALGAGAILGLDLAGMVRNFDASFRGEGARTVYDSISANFSIANGVLSNDDLFLDAPWGTVRGAGTVDLGARTVDYRVIPGVLRNEAGQSGVEVPVLVTGPWSRLRFRPDLEYLAEQEFLEQRDRIAAEAQERLQAEQERIEQQVRDRANELLGTGIEAGDGQAEIEGALQDRLANEVENVLSNLLGGGSRQPADDPATTETGQ
ncbi:AsmA-like C-terminal region-containing protein [Roseibacterium sp. SDUM158017]|uniref:AsmA family protein n=1 Tax=Roseicyclus salinarum TaxID=3036773 RepID=UPI002414F0E9|nr:AsmA-like C-terminal region-containing protein [Roseibacterium sp. SDUM158017]MDG4648263.1 AsmA-like C-terminal region-containing protein [Roseibacterium sp. SDUM158017]